MKTAIWKAALAGVALFILGVAAGAASIDMLDDEPTTNVADPVTVTTIETTTTTVEPAETVTVEGVSEVVPPGWSTCANMRRGYSIAYPGGWYTTHLRPSQACEYFDPEPFEIIPGTEFPPTGLFAFFSTQSVDEYLEPLTDPMFYETLRREETTVNGRPAVFVETSSTGQGESEPGERTYGYVIDRNGRAFAVLAIGLPADERYEEFKAVADRAVETVRFL